MTVARTSITWLLVLGAPVLAVLGTFYASPAVGFLAGITLSVATHLIWNNELKETVSKYYLALEAVINGKSPEIANLDEKFSAQIKVVKEMIEDCRKHNQHTPESTSMIHSILDDIRDSLGRIRELVKGIPTGVAYDQEEIEDLVSSFEKEHSITAELGDYIQTLTAGIEEMNTQAQALKEYALETAMMAEKGKEISDNVALNVASINEVNKEMEQAISMLVSQSKKIGEIVEVIGSIADQTNMLALNASIEAARSGEYGRGFAVVAENIRELADQAKKSTEQISSLIVNMQQSIETVVGSIQREFSVTSEIGNAVQELIAAFDDIARRANETAGMIKDLSESIDGQAQSVQMIMDTMDTVYSVQSDLMDRLSRVSESLLEFSGIIQNVENTLMQINELLNKTLSDITRMEEVMP
jgi:methyl-accepting chemotaxis protein